jgi:hypothetical protein
MTQFLLLISAVLFSFMANASTYVQCGKQVNIDPETSVVSVDSYQLEVSSDDDDYSGAVGISWNMKVDNPVGDWMPTNPRITAKSYSEDGIFVVEITHIIDNSLGGPVGVVYKILDFYSDFPTLEKYNLGGFTGFLKVGRFECFSSHI